jgi:hypothetical protein
MHGSQQEEKGNPKKMDTNSAQKSSNTIFYNTKIFYNCKEKNTVRRGKHAGAISVYPLSFRTSIGCRMYIPFQA